jgi:hypothetical protein
MVERKRGRSSLTAAREVKRAGQPFTVKQILVILVILAIWPKIETVAKVSNVEFGRGNHKREVWRNLKS